MAYHPTRLFGMGTEYRDHYKEYTRAAASHRSPARAGPPALHVGGFGATSSLIGLPPPQPAPFAVGPWEVAAVAPAPVAASTHYRPMSAGYGAKPAQGFHTTAPNAKPLTAARVRYLQGPYLQGAMLDGAGIDGRPTSAQAHFTYSSKRQKEILQQGESNLWGRAAEINAFVAARARQKVQPKPADAYVTQTKAHYTTRPAHESQQHRLKAFNSSKLSTGFGVASLDSTPMSKSVRPLSGGTALQGTRFLGIRAPDGARKLVEVDDPGLPPPTAEPYPFTGSTPALPLPSKFVPSQPVGHSLEAFEGPIFAAV